MLTIAYYFLQVVLCSGIMMGYYWLVLRNKRFHQYNRFYLLFAATASWLIPLIKINVNRPVEEPRPIFNLVNIVADNNSEIENIVVQRGFAINWDAVVVSLYITVSVLFLVSMLAALFRIYQLLKKHSCKNVDDIYLILTNAKGTPFSFFKYIFWNDAVDMNTHTGKQMMQHELTHVREHHSVDKIFIQVVMMFGWFNPFFWLLKKELHLIHEFIADNRTIQNGDASALAGMLLAAAYPQQNFLLTNPFFFSPIKRRLLMLTNTKNTKLSYARRVVALPLLSLVVLLFAFRKKDTVKNNAPLSKVYTVVIDAGHGGTDAGAIGIDGSNEKDLALLLLKAIKENNKNENIKLVFTREGDVFQTPIERAKFVNENKADLFVSLHMNWAPKGSEHVDGFEVDIPKDNNKRLNVEESKLFAGSLEKAMTKSFKSRGIHAKEKGIWVLSATSCPAALIECGFISNEKDLVLLKDKAKQKEMANLILEGIANYLANTDNTKEKSAVLLHSKVESDTSKPQGKAIAVRGNGKHSTNTVVVVAGKDKNTEHPIMLTADTFSTDKRIDEKNDFSKFLVVLDGKKIKYEDLRNLASPDQFQSVHLIRKKEELVEYGEEGKNGVMIITTKKKPQPAVTFVSPLNNSYIAQGFGKYKVDAHANFEGYSDGMLIKSKNDNAVKSLTDGKVVFTGEVGGENVVIVKAEEYYYTYSKIGDVSVHKDDNITKGKMLAKAGLEDNENTVFLMVSNNKGQLLNPASLFASK